MDQDYLAINPSNVVDNIITWDGNPQTWTPHTGYTMLVKETTPAVVWVLNNSVTPAIYELVEVIGAGEVGFTYDGTVVTTNLPDPTVIKTPLNELQTSGTINA